MAVANITPGPPARRPRYPAPMDPEEHAHLHAEPHGPQGGHLRGWLLLGAVAWLLSLAATWWLAARIAAPAPPAAAPAPAAPSEDGAELRRLRQQVTTLKRSDQI